ncbi:MAG: AAA family ATPase, partial [Dehalococcoidia bacterium]
ILPPDPGQASNIGNADIKTLADSLTLRSDAEPPTNKLEALKFNNDLFRLSWEQNREDLTDQSPSGYNQSLASLAAKAKWTDQEIADLLIAWRRGHGHELHLKNSQKYARTILKAKEQASIHEPDQSQTEKLPKAKPLNEAILESSDFLKLQIPERRHFLSPWLKEQSINLISGPRGIGKSLFVMGICQSITSKEPFGSWDVQTVSNTLYLDGEMATSDVQERLRHLMPEGERKASLYIYCDALANSLGLRRANLLNETWRTEIEKFMIDRKVKLWIVDNLASLTPGIDENSKQDYDPVNQWLLHLRFLGISSLLVHHTGKEGQQRGTSAREDNIDVSISLLYPKNYVQEDGARFIVRFTKARIPHKNLSAIADTEFTWQIGINDVMTWTWRNVKKHNKVEVLKLLDEGLSQKNISEYLGIDKGYVSRTVKQAKKDVLISDKGKLTQTGFLYVNDPSN